MSKNITYSIEQTESTIVARSTVKSFNLDHVTDKDITSYYRQISNQALFDTGLLPLNGTGILSIRSAGRHTQIAFQHAPALAYINWGANEGDRNAKAYLLAQPYRIWVADLLDGNLYGARMFYSPYPISHPDQPLYHINLPNTNCKGYRGNGVGWQCLYHNEDWTNISFNDKVNKLIQRCSGIEAYNDANMSETDGPRFYRENNKPEYLWNPSAWQEKSQEEGLDWTLDEDMWIPILVKDMDNQDKHYDDGQPLTFAMALLGNYNSYYNDSYHPKLINAFARTDIDIPTDQVFNVFAQAHNSAKTEPQKLDQFNAAALSKVKIAETFVQPSLFNSPNDDNDDTFTCPGCEESYSENDEEFFADPKGSNWCQSCFQENWVYCENVDTYLHAEDDDAVYMEAYSYYVDAKQANIKECNHCDMSYWITKDSTESFPFYQFQSQKEDVGLVDCCPNCFNEQAAEHLPDLLPSGLNPYSKKPVYTKNHAVCSGCNVGIFVDVPELAHTYVSVPSLFHHNANFWEDIEIDISTFTLNDQKFCLQCAKKQHYCPSGHWTDKNNISIMPFVSTPFVNSKGDEVILKIKEVCQGCLNSKYDLDDPIKSLFTHTHYYYRALSSVYYNLHPQYSTTFELFNTDGSDYSPEPF
jgi:hypothetical protein